MFGSELPSWRQLFGISKRNHASYWDDSECIWTAQSGVSLKLILEEYRDYSNKDWIEVWIPSYFCVETISLFVGENIRIRYYPIDKNLDPDWSTLKSMSEQYEPDVFLFVHYFGVYHDTNNARVFCDRFHSVLIEDCAHVLYNTGKFGVKADFAIYSPHKLLPVPDGAVIYYNRSKATINEIGDRLKEKMNRNTPSQCTIWRVKKAIQKILRCRRSTHFDVKAHQDDLRRTEVNEMYISSWSNRILKEYSHERLKEIAHIRSSNLQTMNYIVKQICKDVIPVIDDKTPCPYMAVYSLEQIENKQQVVNKLEKSGLLVSYWPLLPAEAQKDELAMSMSVNYITIPIHQGMSSYQMIKKYLGHFHKDTMYFDVVQLKDNDDAKESWDGLPVARNNIPQDWQYGEIKTSAEGGQIKRCGIFDKEGKCIGHAQIIIKTKAGIPVAIRVNRGPVLIDAYDQPQNYFEIMRLIRKKIHFPIPWFWAPNMISSPQNMKLAADNRWKCWNGLGYSSGTIDLRKSIDEVRKQLNSKWRNQLKSAEKKDLKVYNDNSLYRKLLDLYLEDQREKGYEGIPDGILERLFLLDPSPLEIYYILNEENNPMIFDIIYLQDQYAHYLVGWNSDEGRKKNLNNLLLYRASIDLKARGITFFDLGGIDHIHTADIAKFKDGMNPDHYMLLGEFVKWF